MRPARRSRHGPPRAAGEGGNAYGHAPSPDASRRSRPTRVGAAAPPPSHGEDRANAKSSKTMRHQRMHSHRPPRTALCRPQARLAHQHRRYTHQHRRAPRLAHTGPPARRPPLPDPLPRHLHRDRDHRRPHQGDSARRCPLRPRQRPSSMRTMQQPQVLTRRTHRPRPQRIHRRSLMSTDTTDRGAGGLPPGVVEHTEGAADLDLRMHNRTVSGAGRSVI